jgi:hypothetical protein
MPELISYARVWEGFQAEGRAFNPRISTVFGPPSWDQIGPLSGSLF